jgi:hypothetical protein
MFNSIDNQFFIKKYTCYLFPFLDEILILGIFFNIAP